MSLYDDYGLVDSEEWIRLSFYAEHRDKPLQERLRLARREGLMTAERAREIYNWAFLTTVH